MKKKFTEAQIVFALRQAESGTPVAEIVRKMEISEVTFYRGKADGQRLYRVLQRSIPSGVFERALVLELGRRPREGRIMAPGLQRESPSQFTRQCDAGRIRCSSRVQ